MKHQPVREEQSRRNSQEGKRKKAPGEGKVRAEEEALQGRPGQEAGR